MIIENVGMEKEYIIAEWEKYKNGGNIEIVVGDYSPLNP